MSGTVLTTFGVVGAALVASLGSVITLLVQARRVTRNEHLQRAFERHLDRYEKIFVGARSAQDALRSYRAISARVTDRSDPFLHQLLTIADQACHDFCVSVTWSHNPAMLYLSRGVEEQCLQARDLMLAWLAVRRVHAGDVVLIRHGSVAQWVPRNSRLVRRGRYSELRVETRRLVLDPRGERWRFRDIDRSLSCVIVELKKVMAY